MDYFIEPLHNASITKEGILFKKGEPQQVSEEVAQRLSEDPRFKLTFKASKVATVVDEEDTPVEPVTETVASAKDAILDVVADLDPDADFEENGMPKLEAVQKIIPGATEAQLIAAMRPGAKGKLDAEETPKKGKLTIKKAKPAEPAPADEADEDAHEI